MTPTHPQRAADDGLRDAPAAVLATRFREFSRVAGARAPLYARLSAGVADAPLVAELFARAPAPARVPVNLFAAVHDLLLAEPDDPLARFYPNLAGGRADPGDPVPDFLAFCAGRADRLTTLLATRLPQTNEVGRSALLLAGLGQLGPGPVALLDVGASAGLNLLLDRFAHLDGRGHRLGASPVEVECSVRGCRPGARGPHGLADHLPEVAGRLGLDLNPVDAADPAAARWLEACVWPDQADRFARLRAALALAAAEPPPILRGDAVADLAAGLDRLDAGRPVVTTSWVLAYLPAAAQRGFVAELDRIGSSRDLAWVWAEEPQVVGALPVPEDLAGERATVLGVSTWRAGTRTDRVLARCHPHGYWLHWR